MICLSALDCFDPIVTLYLLGVLFFFLGDLASLDRTIVMYNRSRGSSMLKKDLLYVYDMRVDMVVIVDAIARARRDKVNVVRNAALYAMKCVDALEQTREGGGESGASGEGGGSGSGALCREVREVPNEVVEEKEQNSSSSCSQAYESKYNESAVSSRQNTRRSDRSEQRHVSHHHHHHQEHHHQQERQQQLQQQQQQEEDEDEEDVFLEEEEEMANLISTLSSEDTKELNGALHQCMSGGGSVLMSTLLGGWLEEGAENLVSSFMMEIVDDGTTP